MSFLKRLFPDRSAPQTPAYALKESAAGPLISAWHVGQPVWTPREYAPLAKEAYVQNAVAMRCVKLIATSAAHIAWLLQDSNGDDIEQHPALELLKRPNPMLGGSAFFEAVFANLVLAGNSYVEAIGPERAPPRELWTLRPDRMKVIPGAKGIPAAYRYEYQGQIKDWKVDPMRGRSNVLHLKEFHPINDWYGMSRVEPGAYGIDRHNAAGAHNKALLDNGARPSGAMVFEPVKVSADGPDQNAPQEVINAAHKELMKRHGGPENAGKPMVLNGNVKWLDMATSPKDMDFGESKLDAARDICTAFGVPHILIVPGSATYNNIREAKLEFYEDTVLPLHDRVCDDLNTWLRPRYGDDFELKADLDGISALEPRREAKRQSVRELHKDGIIDADEARELLQFGPRPENAVKKVDAAVLAALVSADMTMGSEPLQKYMRSVGLWTDDFSPPEDEFEDAELNDTPGPDDALGEDDRNDA